MTKNTERNLKKRRVNPYLFYLLVAMLKFEVAVTGKKASVRNVLELVYQKTVNKKKYKDSKLFFSRQGKYEVVIPIDPIAKNYAIAMKKNFLNPQEDLIATLEMRNRLARLVTVLDEFDSWHEFESKYGGDYGSLSSEKYRVEKYVDLPFYIKNYIDVWISRRMSGLISKCHLAGGMSNEQYRNILVNTGDYIIRNATDDDIREIEKFAKQMYPDTITINGYDTKKRWYDANPNIFYVNYNFYKMLEGNVNLLPLRPKCYQQLRNGKLFETEILSSDIYSTDEKEVVKHIYIEGLACVNNIVFASFVERFKDMLASICNIDNDKLVICAIGGSAEGEQLMQNCGFKKICDSIDPVTGKAYPFREITWGELKSILSKSMQLENRRYAYHGKLNRFS